MDRKEHGAYVKRYREELFPHFETYANFLGEVLRGAIQRCAPLSVIQSRPKSVSSFAEKIVRKGYDLPFHQATDLCGARVITVTEEQMEAVSEFVKANFTVDYANSLDLGERLGACEFGYRALHYVVQLRPGKCGGVTVPRELLPTDEIAFKAEIQVRTLLQHGWAEVLHDRIHKNHIKAPRSLEREGARLAALLEEGDRLLTSVVKDLDAYLVDINAHMKEKEIHREITNLELIFSNETDLSAKENLALRMCELLRAGNQWLAISALLQSLAKESAHPALLREYGNALCEGHRDAPRSAAYAQGQEMLLRALERDPACADTHALLARSYQRQPRSEINAHTHFREAYHLAPEDPYHFIAYIEYELLHAPSTALVPLMLPALRRAVAVCVHRIAAGIDLSRACLTLGKLYLLLGDGHACLNACAMGLGVVLRQKAAGCADLLELELDSLARLDNAKGGLPGGAMPGDTLVEALRRLLLVSIHLVGGDPSCKEELRKLQRHVFDPEDRVLMVAGSCAPGSTKQTGAFGEVLKTAVADFEGAVIGGGSKAGISGVVGDMKSVTGRRFKTVGYLPKGKTADSRYDVLIKSDTPDYTPLDTLQAWVDVITSGIPPERVSLLGYGGGEITGVEYRIGLALGASVGVMADSGDAAQALLEDNLWVNIARPLGLPPDPMTVRAFVNPGRGSIPEQKREELARAIHAAYCGIDPEKVNKRILRENGLPWEDLPRTYRDANFAQADYIGEILRTEGFRLESGAPDPNGGVHFEKDQVERMAEKEHGRWNVDRLRDGWKPGSRNDEKKIHDCLVPWVDLPDDIKQFDRNSVNSWIGLLANVEIKIKQRV